jgi:hypothetical protein
MKLQGPWPFKDELERLGRVGFVGERKALALMCLGFYATLFFLIGLSARTELPEWVPVFVGMMLVYLTGFFAVAAEWFWGRWFATGIGYWGVTMTGMALVAARGLPPAMVVFGTMHALITVCLAGEKMAVAFDAKPGWRERWKLDEQGVVRVRRSVTRAASSLPALIMFALAPRESAGLGVTLFAIAALGLGGVLARRTWGVLALGAGGLLGIGAALGLCCQQSLGAEAMGLFGGLAPIVATPALLVGFAGAALLAAALPFAAPMARFLRR